MATLIPFPGTQSAAQQGPARPRQVFFARQELMALIAVYSTYVARGEWRDYALDHLRDRAVFSIFRHTHEHPVFTVTKLAGPKQQTQPLWVVMHGPRQILRTGLMQRAVEALREAAEG